MVSTSLWNRRHGRQALADDVVSAVVVAQRERRQRDDRAPEPQRVFFGYRSIGSISEDLMATTQRWRAHNAAGNVISTHTYRWQAERAAEALGMVRIGGAE